MTPRWTPAGPNRRILHGGEHDMAHVNGWGWARFALAVIGFGMLAAFAWLATG